MKRIFIIVAGIVVVIGIVVGLYFLFFKGGDATITVGNPFDGTGAGNATPSSDLPTDGTLQNAGTTLAPRFVKITDGPVARGAVAMDVQVPAPGTVTNAAVSTQTTETAVSLGAGTSTTTSTTTQTTAAVPVSATKPDTEVRFIDRASGNVYSYLSTARTLTRISNKTLPGIQLASWVPDGSRAYVQFLASSGGAEHVNTYSLTAKGGEGYLLDTDLAQAEVAGSSTLVTLFSGTSGSVATISRADGSSARTLFSSVLSALTIHPTTGDLFATNKPSASIDGYAFQINRTTGGFSRLLGPFRGLSVLPSVDGKQLLYSYTDAGVYRLRALDVSTRTSTALPVGTLTEKCVWARDGLSAYCAVPTNLQGTLPDDWYQGATVFSDRIWKIDLTQRLATLVLDPSQVGKVSVDAVNLTLDPSETLLVFTDKHSGALYAYSL